MNKLIFLALSFLSFSIPVSGAHAQGSGVRGDGIVKFNRVWKLRDIANLEGVGEKFTPPKDMIKQFVKITQLVEDYTGVNFKNYWEKVYGDSAAYRMVDTLPCKPDQSSNTSLVAQYNDTLGAGCTTNGISYISKSAFERLGKRPNGGYDQLTLLLHERAHVFDVSSNSHDWIDVWTQGIYLLMVLNDEQNKNAYRVLEEFEYQALGKFIALSSNLYNKSGPKLPGRTSKNYDDGFANSTSRYPAVKINRFGGGIIVSANSIALERIQVKNTFVSVDSKISFPYKHCLDAFLIVEEISVESSKLTHHSNLTCVNLKRAQLVNSSVIFSDTIVPHMTDVNFFNSRVEVYARYSLFDHVFLNKATVIFGDHKNGFSMHEISISRQEIDFTVAPTSDVIYPDDDDYSTGMSPRGFFSVAVVSYHDRNDTNLGGKPLSSERKKQNFEEANFNTWWDSLQ